jgi:hypothetical protein
MKYEIQQEVLEATLQYLNTQPYGNVAKLIMALQQSRPIQEVVEDKKK